MDIGKIEALKAERENIILKIQQEKANNNNNEIIKPLNLLIQRY